ncbi:MULTISPECIES: NmrA family NAD(P)-binding protein [unclassified Streptosporangium]|uniref:NmrA family NAD(P)-binding protein n=1 Tax=unclassified Streptosporangium TaxID=2632669 RepID=UPI002E27DAA5|nr:MULTISPECIES: NmrA family NAD(P)-binding protein [unclassified Streptosporangium]
MIVVTGATGQLGRLVVDGLLERVPADRVVAAVRTPGKAADLAARGVKVKEADYERPETLKRAFAPGDTVLLISGDAVGRRLGQHRAVVDAARAAGVARIVYTSVLHADTTPLALAVDHRGTEEHIRASGIPFTFLRNGFYTEVYAASVLQGVEHGAILGAAGDGRVAGASRADYAAAAVTVLTREEDGDKVYELSGDTAWSLPELAAEASAVSGRPVVYRNLPHADFRRALIDAGLPEPVATMYADIDLDIVQGALSPTPGELSALIGRPTTPLRESVAAILKEA